MSLDTAKPTIPAQRIPDDVRATLEDTYGDLLAEARTHDEIAESRHGESRSEEIYLASLARARARMIAAHLGIAQ